MTARDTLGRTNPTSSPLFHKAILHNLLYPYLLGKECRYAFYKVRTKSLIMRQCSVDCRVHSEVVPTEYSQSGIGHFLAYIPSWWKNQPSLVRVGGALHAPPHSIYHHVQRCGVRSSWKGRHTPPISTLPLYVLCGYASSPPPHPPTFYLSSAVLAVHRILHSQYARSFHNLHSFQFF